MKVVCTQENLKVGLSKVGRIITSSNTLPILNNLLLKTENGLLKISSTNLEISIHTLVRCKIEEPGEVCLPAKIFTDLIQSLPNTNIVLTKHEKEIQVNTDNYSAVVKSLSADEFPLIPSVESVLVVKLPAKILHGALDSVLFAASTNETQPEISGICLTVSNGMLKLVATDRYRLAEWTTKIPTIPDFSVILPYKTGQELVRALSGLEVMVEVVVGDNQVLFLIGETSIVSRLIDGQYPEYGNIIPQSFLTTIQCDRSAMLGALKTSGVFSYGTNSVRFGFEDNGAVLTVSSGGQDVGESIVSVPCVVRGPGSHIIFNYRYIQDVLGVLRGEEIVLYINNDSAPVVFKEVGEESYMYLVMPIKQ